MREEWRIFWKEGLRKQRSGILSLGVALLFWLAQLPNSRPDEVWLDLRFSIVYGLIVWGCISLTFFVGWAVATQMMIMGYRLRPGWTFNLSLSLIGTGSGIWICENMKSYWFGRPVPPGEWVGSAIMGFVVMIAFLFFYAYKESRAENASLKAAKAETELHVFKNQMQPHFLFNSLNSLSELIEQDSGAASGMAMKLSDLYREILESSKMSLVPLSTELSIIRKYLELEELRFGSRLKFVIEAPAGSERVLVPPLVLQTLVENAVKHGISPSVNGGEVRVSVVPKAGASGYEVRVWNSGPLRESLRAGTGLVNTRSRLDLLYGDRHGFALDTKGESVEARFWVSGHA